MTCLVVKYLNENKVKLVDHRDWQGSHQSLGIIKMLIIMLEEDRLRKGSFRACRSLPCRSVGQTDDDAWPGLLGPALACL